VVSPSAVRHGRPGIAVVAWLMDRLLGTRDREEIRAKAEAA